jgi:transcription elongation GreA/GreB family factor
MRGAKGNDVSVAFRRDSDEEHKEPKFDIPIPPGPNLVTARGLALIAARVDELEAGNPAADEAEAHARELRYWRARLATAHVAPLPAPGEVAFGAHVRYRLNGAERAIAIVGSDEADPEAGLIAFTAPLARAMIGAEVGEEVDFAGRDGAITIIDAAPIAD